MAVGPDFRARARAVHERIVGRYAAIGVQAYQLALQLVQILGRGTLVVFAQSDEQVAVAIEHQPCAEMDAGGQLGLLLEDALEVFESRAIVTEAPAPHGGAGLAIAGLGVGEIDQPVLCELRRQRHLQQAALAPGIHRRHPVDGRRQPAADFQQA